jgi:molecular chaperone GrpE (heat shock protein)
MLKLLTRKDLWVAIAFSACFWFGLPKVAPALAKYSAPFAGLVLLLSILSLILGQIEQEEDKGKAMDEAKAQEGDSLHSALATQNEAQRKLQEELAALRKDIKSIKANPGKPAADIALTDSAPAAEVPAKLGELSGALSEAMKQITSRDSQIDLLTKNVNQANIQRNLVRLSQSLEVARALQVRVGSGKSDPKESFDFVVDDLDSALSDQGVESMEVAVGTKVADLAAGSFAAISVVDAPEDALRGTVKEVRSRCYFISEDGKKPRFIAPAKVILYRA